LVDTAKCKSRWAESFLNNLILLGKYLSVDESHISIEGENKLKIFLDVIDKAFDAKSLHVFYMLINDDKDKRAAVFTALRSILNGDDKEKIETYVEKLTFIKLGMSCFDEKKYDWLEDSESACKLELINRDQMIKSFVRDGNVMFSTVVIEGKTVKFIDEKSDKYIREKNFISTIVNGIVSKQRRDYVNIDEIVTSLVNRQHTILDPILWSFTISAWANAELMVREHLKCLFQRPYSTIISDKVDCSIRLHQSFENFTVTTRKSYTVYPCSPNRGHGADKRYPLMEVFCSWTLSPVLNKDDTKSWKGTLKVKGFQKKKIAPVAELCRLVRTITKNIYEDK